MREILSALRFIPAAGRYLGGFILFAFLILLLGPRFGLSRTGTYICVAGLAVAFGLFYLIGFIRKRKEKKKSKDFEGSLGVQSREAGVGKEEIREALAELSQRWELAVKELRETGVSIYDLPWFLLIGEPQSGKSTTIKNSGLEFPVGTEALSGSGGTRNCDWWFTNEAVILDTAGRFTFQETAAPDQHEWNAFLKLLSKHRKQCPINGVIVVIPVTSLVEDPVDIRDSKAKNIRTKLMNLQKTLGIRFPVTVLVTKCDRVLGFTEFFSKLDPIDQRQLFGWSSTKSHEEAWDAKSFDKHFEEIVSRVHKMRLRFFHGEDNTSNIDKLFVFPEELHALREPLAQYLNVIFSASRFEEPMSLRGYYFTSGVQQGRPIAQACRDLLRVQAGDPLGVLEDLEQVFRKSRAFFIRDFYEKKLFPEQGLVSRTRAAIKKDQVRQRIIFGVAVPLAVLFLVFFSLAVVTLKTTVGNFTVAVDEAEQCISGTKQCTVKKSYDLIEDLEGAKRRLREKRWALWMFGRTANNAVNNTYLPAVQAELFRTGVLPHVLESFDTRSRDLDWGKYYRKYPNFHGALDEALSFAELQEAKNDPERARELKRRLSVNQMIAFCQATKGEDNSEIGLQIDEWLDDKPAIPGEANSMVFKPILGTNPRIARLDVGLPKDSIEAMRQYWTVFNLARWDSTLIDTYFKGYLGMIDEIQGLAPASADRRRAALDEYEGIATRFTENWEAGRDHMERGRPTSETDRPGPDTEKWQDVCREDFAILEEISEDVAAKLDAEPHCAAIPGDLVDLRRDLEAYDYLYDERQLEGEGAGTLFEWTPDAVLVKDVVAGLARVVPADATAEAVDEYTSRIESRPGRDQELKAVADYYTEQYDAVKGALKRFSEFQEPDLEGVEGPLEDVAALALAERVVPPTERYFVSKVFPDGDERNFNEDYAKDNVHPANAFLTWAYDELGDVARQRETADELASVNSAIYDYLSEFVERERRAGGGAPSEVRTVYNRPKSAAATNRWADFTDEVAKWKPLRQVGGGGRSVSSGGLKVDTVRDFEDENASLRGLADQLASSRRPSGRRTSSGPPIAETLDKAIKDFKACISALEDRPLEAWKQLAGEGSRVSLDDFHAFTSNPRLNRDNEAQWLANNLEKHGARLLAEAIRPDFLDAFRRFWDEVDYCCRDTYPFITQRDLKEFKDDYDRGFVAPRAGDRRDRDLDDDRRDRGRYDDRRDDRRRSRRSLTLWKEQHRDAGRREISNIMDLETVDDRDLEDLFDSRGRLGELRHDFAIEPILSGKETMIDFLGDAKEKLIILGEWQEFLFGRASDRGEDRRGGRSREDTFRAHLLNAETTSRDAVFLGERVGLIKFFGDNFFRPSTDAHTGKELEIPFMIDNTRLDIVGQDEDRSQGWTGRLEIEGGPLKLLYFVQIASLGKPSRNRTIWEVRVEIPDYDRPNSRLEGIYVLEFDKPIPRVFPDPVSRDRE